MKKNRFIQQKFTKFYEFSVLFGRWNAIFRLQWHKALKIPKNQSTIAHQVSAIEKWFVKAFLATGQHFSKDKL